MGMQTSCFCRRWEHKVRRMKPTCVESRLSSVFGGCADYNKKNGCALHGRLLFHTGSDYYPRVTVIIRTRQKCSIKAIFVAFAVALRQQGYHLKMPNLIFTPSIFDALQFSVCRFGLNQGKNAVNPFGLTSILTKSKGNICHAKPWFELLPLP